MQTPAPHSNRRLLVIDDNHAIHDDFRKILKPQSPGHDAMDATEASLFGEEAAAPKASGYEVDSAYQGQEGFELVRQALAAGRPYAMAFVDVRMPPGWDGIETTAKIWEVDPHLQVVICTAYSDYSWDDMITKVGQSDRFIILKKPFDNIEVLQLASSLTSRWQMLQNVNARLRVLEQQAAACSR